MKKNLGQLTHSSNGRSSLMTTQKNVKQMLKKVFLLDTGGQEEHSNECFIQKRSKSCRLSSSKKEFVNNQSQRDGQGYFFALKFSVKKDYVRKRQKNKNSVKLTKRLWEDVQKMIYQTFEAQLVLQSWLRECQEKYSDKCIHVKLFSRKNYRLPLLGYGKVQ